MEPFGPHLGWCHHPEHERQDQGRDSPAAHGQQLFAELAPLLPDDGSDVADHRSPPRRSLSSAMSARKASSSEGRIFRTSSISTPRSTSIAMIGAMRVSSESSSIVNRSFVPEAARTPRQYLRRATM